MNLRKVESYDIGLDIGSGSVGWAVIDEQGDLARFKGRPAWGSRIFPEADSASDARAHRGQRRRYDRRRQRLDLLQGIFAEEMEGADEDFFIRLNQSRLHPEDRADDHADYRWPLFNGKGFTEKDYYKRFPTIYHVRAWLMETDEKADIRLIYLAFHNIVKHRGNFLHQDNPGLSAKNADLKAVVDRLCDALEEWCENREIECRCNRSGVVRALQDDSLRTRERQEAVGSALGIEKEYKQMATALSKAVVGYSADFSKVFFVDADESNFALSNEDKIESFACPDEGIELFAAMQAVYSAFVLMGILQGSEGKTISFCKVAEYERYRKDLRHLKDLTKEYAPHRYDGFFRGECYEGASAYDPEKADGYTKYDLGTSKLSHDDFLKAAKELLEEMGETAHDDKRFEEIRRSIEEKTFLRRLKTSDNGSIPYQLHLEEMKEIIDRQSRYYPFLSECRKEIESLVTFRIPYYVGPLTQKNAALDALGNARFAWSCRKPSKENAKVNPWDWEEVIDKDASAEAFIRRMTGTCTYIQGEPVLPKHSLVYEMFCVLNELNGAKWTQDGDRRYRFDFDDRMGILEDLFKRRKTVSYKAVEAWLERTHGPNGQMSAGGSYKVSGGQGEAGFESKLNSYRDFCDILEVDELDDVDVPMIEDIILWNTVFEDRSILKRKIKLAYGDLGSGRLADGQIQKICRKRYTGWGRLSAKFLKGIKVETDNGLKSIMDILLDGDPNHSKRLGRAMNLRGILHDESLGFDERIRQENERRLDAAGGPSVGDLPGSPALKRAVNQALRIVDEIVGIAGKPPVHIFVEVTRSEDAKKKGRRTRRRYQQIEAALAVLKQEYADVYRELKEREKHPQELDDKRLALYFMQCGKSMYSERPLDINRLSEYQIDHIIPQSYIKDDSFDNMALVLRDENQRKLDTLLLDPSIIKRMRGFWKSLRDVGLVSEKKFRNLTRSEGFSDEQLRGFINRQLVETGQITKHVQELLRVRYGESRVLPVKAGFSHQLRVACRLSKCREINDFHHAHDAYLASQIGRFICYRHGDVFDNPVKMEGAVRQIIKKQAEDFRRGELPGTAGFVVSSFLTSGFDTETGEVFRDTWDRDFEVDRIRRCLDYKDCFISRMPEETSGKFWDATIYSPKDKGKRHSLPLKKGLDPEKYGRYSGEQFAYFFVYEAIKGPKRKRVVEFAPVPVWMASSLRDNPKELDVYAADLAQSKGLEFVRILKRKVLKYQQIILGDSRLHITGLKEVRNACQFAFSQEETELVCRMVAGNCCEEELVALFDTIAKSFARYAPRLGRQLKVGDMREAFLQAAEADKAAVLLALISIAAGKTNMIDLRAVGGSKMAGCMRPTFSKELTSPDVDFWFVDVSVTGMFERRYRLGV